MVSYRRILVPSDFDTGAAGALDAALALARQSNAAVGIFHVVTPPWSFALYAEGLAWPTDELNAEANKIMNDVVGHANALHPHVTGSVVMGAPWEAILAQSGPCAGSARPRSCCTSPMWTALGAAVDLIHALSMAVWLLGLPLLFVRRWRRLRLGYATYAVFFIVASQLSMWLEGECFLTTLARWCVEHDPLQRVDHQWFTERIAHAVFGLAPSHQLVSWVSEALVLVTALLVLGSVIRSHRRATTLAPSP